MSSYSDYDSSSDMSDMSDMSDISDVNCEEKNDYINIYDRMLKCYQKIEVMDNEINDKVKELNEYIKNINKNKKDILRDLKKDITLIDKLYKKNLSIIPKKRKKQTKIQGFNNVEKIPKLIKDYCGDIIPNELNEASRPFVMSALHKAFKRDGLKIGRDTILNKKASKILNREEGLKIIFSQYQKFLASFYKN
jgi:hypothetical protein